MARKKRTTAKRKPLTPEQLLKREKTFFKKKIRNIFTTAGFQYIPTNDHEIKIGRRTGEIDSLFIYENIWILCEDTVKTTNIRDHIRTKDQIFGEIFGNLDDFKKILLELFPEKSDIFSKYDTARIKPFAFYISKYEIPLENDDISLFDNLTFIQPQTLDYFNWIAKSIRLSARFEIFRFLNLSNRDIGLVSSASTSTEIVANIIYPKEITGMKNNVHVVSFMMSAEDLLNTCYVMRKDNWEQSIWLYQRLIDPNKIKNVRSFIEKNGETFYNNIIVALPDNVKFLDASDNYIELDKISDFEANCKLIMPKEDNSICVIDGQHRIFAHYESGLDNKQEREISRLRKQLHLLVTGLVFPKDMSKEKRIQIQSKIFLDINSNAKPVDANVLLRINRIMCPIESESLAQLVVEKLNKQEPFKNSLQISTFGQGKIKTASIVRFALRYLVTVTPADGKQSLYNYWDGDKKKITDLDDDAINEYTDFCVGVLRKYFCAVKKNLSSDWDDPNSKLMTVVSINGFIIALTRQLPYNGIKDFEFYDKSLNGWSYDFSKDGFPFTSSQYRKFSNVILKEVFNLSDDESIIDTTDLDTSQ